MTVTFYIIVRILVSFMKIVGHILSSLLLMGCTLLSFNTYAQYDLINASGANDQPETITNQQEESNQRIIENERSGDGFDLRESSKVKIPSSETNRAKDNVTPQVEMQKSEASSDKVSKNKKQENDNGDDSVLSFNFFYYMIQKFKFSDLEE